VAYNKIYIVGGTDGYKVLSEVHEYFTQVIPGLTYLDGLNGLEGNTGIFDSMVLTTFPEVILLR